MAERIKTLHPMTGKVLVKRDEVETMKDLGGGKHLVVTTDAYAEYDRRFNDRATVLSIGAPPVREDGTVQKLQYIHAGTGETVEVKPGDRVLISPNLGVHAKLSNNFEVDVMPYSGIIGVFEVEEYEEEPQPEEYRLYVPTPNLIIAP